MLLLVFLISIAILGPTEKVEYLMNTDVLSVKTGCFCRNIFRNYRFSKIEKDPKQGGMTENPRIWGSFGVLTIWHGMYK